MTILGYLTKSDFAGVIKLRTLRGGDYPGLPKRVQCSHGEGGGLYKWKRKAEELKS